MKATSTGPHYFPDIVHADGTPIRMPPGRYAYETGRSENRWRDQPTHSTGRPEGDHRSALDIIRDNPILGNFRRATNSDEQLEENLKRHLGDWTPLNTNAETRADAMYNLARVLNYIDHLSGPEGNGPRYPGNIDGFKSESGYAAPGQPSYPFKIGDTWNLVPELTNGTYRQYTTEADSEARLLESFSYRGYAVFKKSD